MMGQFYSILDQYFKYETSTFVVIDQMKDVILPKLHIRMNAAEILKDRKGCENMQFCRANESDYESNSTLINYHHTPKIEDIVLAKECKLKSLVDNEFLLCSNDSMRRGSMH